MEYKFWLAVPAFLGCVVGYFFSAVALAVLTIVSFLICSMFTDNRNQNEENRSIYLRRMYCINTVILFAWVTCIYIGWNSGTQFWNDIKDIILR